MTQRAQQIVDRLLEGSAKDSVMFWGGNEPLKQELQSYGWRNDVYTKDAMSKKVSTNDGKNVRLLVAPNRKNRWWQLSVWSDGAEFGDYLLTTIDGIPSSHIVQAATDTEDLIGIWVNDDPHMDLAHQMIVATDDVAKAAERWQALLKESGDAKSWLMHGYNLDLADMAFWTIDGEYVPKGLD